MGNKCSLIFNIQKYSVHDGPGIRTIVFLKGCPLNCPWCANPEGKGFMKELHFNENLCKKCGNCIKSCPEDAIHISEDKIQIDRKKCTVCGKCVDACSQVAYKVFGEEKTIDEILNEVAKDEIFYKRSGGGLTLSGGEPLSHGDFTVELLKKAREQYGLNTAIETTCYASEEMLRKVMPYIDYVFCDIKLMDKKGHTDMVGVSNDQILSNIRIIDNEYPKKPLVLRLPLIPGYNDSEENIKETAAFIKSLTRNIPLEILPYHMFGKNKYAGLGHDYPAELEKVGVPEKEYIQEITERFIGLGVEVVKT